MKLSAKSLASLEMIFSTMIWGFGFVATQWALLSADTITLSVFRFFVAFLIGHIILFLPFFRKEISWQNIKLSCGPGLLLGTMLIFQTWGLELTSVTNSGFITTLYVVFVPIIEFLFLRKKPQHILWVWIFVALIGTALMVNLHHLNLNKGDILTFLCAIIGAGQIVWVSRVSHRIQSPFAFNVYQSLWGATASLMFLPFYQKTYFYPPGPKSIIGILAVTIGSTLLAFALQIKAQRVLPATTASLFFLFESPFATLFAMILLNEPVTHWQSVGAALIFFSAMGATLTIKSKPA